MPSINSREVLLSSTTSYKGAAIGSGVLRHHAAGIL